MPTPDAPTWYSKPISVSAPAGIAALVILALGGAGAVGGVQLVGAVEPASAPALEALVDARVEVVQREAAVTAAAAEAVGSARYEEILRRLDRIERRIDSAPIP